MGGIIQVLGKVYADRYRVVGHIGSGGMGDVFAVEHTVLGRRFALKRMQVHGAEHRVAVERFLREARAAAATGHPGVVEVFDLGFDGDGNPFLVMELLQGQSLRERLRVGPLLPQALLPLAEGILEPLGAVHAAGIVHRDLKPDNVFLVPQGSRGFRVKLLDFGLARTDDGADQQLTQAGAVLGTPLYMAPEQARGETVDSRTDLYAVGAMLYEAACGKPPFRGATYAAILGQMLTTPADPLPLGPLSQAWRATILRALAKKPADRFATAEAMAAALRGDGFAEIEPYLAAPSGAQVVVIRGADPTTAVDVTLDGNTPAPPTADFAPTLDSSVGVAAQPSSLPGALPDVESLVQSGQIDAAQERMRRAALRAKGDFDVQARACLLELLGKRDRAYKSAAALDQEQLGPCARAAIDGLLALRNGVPALGIAPVAAACARWPDDAMLGYLHGRLCLESDQFERSRQVYEVLLTRWPAFEPAVNRLLEPLLLRDEVQAAEDLVDAYIANAPDGAELDMLEIELWVGQHRYTEALDRIRRDMTANPAREKEFFRLLGDVLVLVGDPAGAIAAYDRIEKRERRDNCVLGALWQLGRHDEARALLADAIASYDADNDARVSRLGTLCLDAALWALETGDAGLAALVAERLRGVTSAATEMRFSGDRAFCLAAAAQFAGRNPDFGLLRDDKGHPLVALLDARRDPSRAVALLGPVCAPAAIRDGTVSSHVLPVLWADYGCALVAYGRPREALAWLDRALRPRHFEPTRGIVWRRATQAKVAALQALGRPGEAAAVARALAAGA